jgi:hypothetical protein
MIVFFFRVMVSFIIIFRTFSWQALGMYRFSYIHLFLWSASPPFMFSVFRECECLFSVFMFYIMPLVHKGI